MPKNSIVDDREAKILQERFLNALEREPDDIQLLVVECMSNFINASNWAFISKNSPDYDKKVAFLKTSKVVKMYEVANGVMITVPLENLYNILHRVSPELYSQKELGLSLDFRKKSITGFVNLLKSGVRQAKVGIYSLNDSPNITVGGHVYKAFNIDLAMAAMYLRDAGYSILIKGRPLPAANVLIEDKFPIVLKQLELAPSGNGLMLDIVKN